MTATFIVGNRLPVAVVWNKERSRWRVEYAQAGGVVTTMREVQRLTDAVYVGPRMNDDDELLAELAQATTMSEVQAISAGISAARNKEVAYDGPEKEDEDLEAGVVRPRDGFPSRIGVVRPGPEQWRLFYEVFANPFLWFTQHWLYTPDRGLYPPPAGERLADLRRAWVDGYKPVNQQYADEVVSQALQTDPAESIVVMTQDYQLYLVPQMIREKLARAGRTNVTLQHFVHIPWPEPSVWDAIPADIRGELLRGLLGNDIVGFQTPVDAGNFLSTCEAELHLTVDREQGTVTTSEGRVVQVRDYPISIDPGRFEAMMRDERVSERRREIRRGLPYPDMLIIGRVDRMDISKNIPGGFKAYEKMLEAHPESWGWIPFSELIRQHPEYGWRQLDELMREHPELAEVARTGIKELLQEHVRRFGKDSEPLIEGLIKKYAALSTGELINDHPDLTYQAIMAKRPDLRGQVPYEGLVKLHPELVPRVQFHAFLQPSRGGIDEYRQYQEQVLDEVVRINARFGVPGAPDNVVPIIAEIGQDSIKMVALYAESDVQFVNPYADGMNLTGLEAMICNQRDGAIGLSLYAGAYQFLAPFVHGLDPHNHEQMGTALHEALTNPRRMLEQARAYIRAHDVTWWYQRQLLDIQRTMGQRFVVPPVPPVPPVPAAPPDQSAPSSLFDQLRSAQHATTLADGFKAWSNWKTASLAATDRLRLVACEMFLREIGVPPELAGGQRSEGSSRDRTLVERFLDVVTSFAARPGQSHVDGAEHDSFFAALRPDLGPEDRQRLEGEAMSYVREATAWAQEFGTPQAAESPEHQLAKTLGEGKVARAFEGVADLKYCLDKIASMSGRLMGISRDELNAHALRLLQGIAPITERLYHGLTTGSMGAATADLEWLRRRASAFETSEKNDRDLGQ